MSKVQAPKTRGLALTNLERIAWRGLINEQQRLQQLWDEAQREAAELKREIEGRFGLPKGALGGLSKPPTHDVDRNSWNVVELEQLPGEQNGAAPLKLKTHAQADAVAVELGLEFEKRAKLSDKVAAIEAARQVAAA